MSKRLHSTTVAKQFLELSEDGLTQLQLQKLVYFAHGMYSIDHEDGLVYDDLEAWKYGPIYRELWDVTGDYGMRTIRHIDSHLAEKPDKDQTMVIQEVFNSFGGLTGNQLSSMAHLDDSPWSQVSKKKPNENSLIPNAAIRKYFIEFEKQA